MLNVFVIGNAFSKIQCVGLKDKYPLSLPLPEMLGKLLASAFESYDLENMITAFLLARQGALEGPSFFPSYSEWFKVGPTLTQVPHNHCPLLPQNSYICTDLDQEPHGIIIFFMECVSALHDLIFLLFLNLTIYP